MSKYGALIQEAKKQESQQTRKPEEEKVSEPDVNLSIKVSISRRRHWAAEAKRQGITLTAVILEALSQKFGEPK